MSARAHKEQAKGIEHTVFIMLGEEVFKCEVVEKKQKVQHDVSRGIGVALLPYCLRHTLLMPHPSIVFQSLVDLFVSHQPSSLSYFLFLPDQLVQHSSKLVSSVQLFEACLLSRPCSTEALVAFYPHSSYRIFVLFEPRTSNVSYIETNTQYASETQGD